jgi:hypothetical protein
MDTITWVREQQRLISEWTIALNIVIDRIAGGAPVVLACEGCGEALGVFHVLDHIVRCAECERAQEAAPRSLTA